MEAEDERSPFEDSFRLIAPYHAGTATPQSVTPHAKPSSSSAAPAKQQQAPKGAQQPAPGTEQRPDPRGPKPTNRAERRALQEAQKAAKAQTKVRYQSALAM